MLATGNLGEIRLAKSNIKNIEVITPERMRKGQYWFDNPNDTRYLFSPTAIPLRRGEGYYQNSYLVINMFNAGVTNHFSMGGGFELITTFTGNPTLFITPKVSGQVGENWYLGGGAFAGIHADFGGELEGSGAFGICYGMTTYGNSDDNITAGLGFGFVNDAFQERPFITLSGMKRISKKLGFVSENWIFPVDGYDFAISYALRFMSEKIAVDYGFINHPEIAKEIFIGIPYIDFVVKFGK